MFYTFSNKLRQILQYNVYVKHRFKSSSLCGTSSTLSVLSITLLKRFTNQTKEY